MVTWSIVNQSSNHVLVSGTKSVDTALTLDLVSTVPRNIQEVMTYAFGVTNVNT